MSLRRLAVSSMCAPLIMSVSALCLAQNVFVSGKSPSAVSGSSAGAPAHYRAETGPSCPNLCPDILIHLILEPRWQSRAIPSWLPRRTATPQPMFSLRLLLDGIAAGGGIKCAA